MLRHQTTPKFLHTLAKAEYQALPTESLLDRYLSDRDEAALSALVDRFAGLVYRRCRAVLPRDDLVQEAFQETFRAMAEHAHRLRRTGAIGSWLNTTAYRQAVTIHRREGRRARREVAMGTEVQDPRSTDAIAQAERREAVVAVTAALAALPDRFRLPIELVYLDGMTHAKAANVLGCPKGTVDSAVKRGLTKLQTALSRAGLLPVIASVGTVEAILAGQVSAVPPTLLAAAAQAAAAVVPSSVPVASLASWLPSRRVVWMMTLAAVGGASGVLAWFGGDKPQPVPVPPIRVTDPEPLPDRNLRLFRADILPRMAAELQPLAFNGGQVVVTASTASDALVLAEFEARHKDAPIGMTVSRLRVKYDTATRVPWVYVDELGTGRFKRINVDKPVVIFRIKELKLEFALDVVPLRRALGVLAELPLDSRAEATATEYTRRLRAALEPLVGMWYITGDPARPRRLALSEEPGLHASLQFDGNGPYLADLILRPDGRIEWPSGDSVRLSANGRRLTFDPSGEWWTKDY